MESERVPMEVRQGLDNQRDFPVDEMESIIKELLDKMDFVIDHVKEMLPATFPEEVAQPIFISESSVLLDDRSSMYRW